MRVLLVATNQADRFMDRMVVRPVPIGLAYIAAAVDESRHELKVLDLMFSDDGAGDVESAVRDFRAGLGGAVHPQSGQPELLQPGVEPAGRPRHSGAHPLGERRDDTVRGAGRSASCPPSAWSTSAPIWASPATRARRSPRCWTDWNRGSDYADIPGMVYRRDGEVTVSEGRFTSYFHNAPRLDLLDMQRYNGSGLWRGRGY